MKDIMQFRFACKHFDVAKKVEDSVLRELLDLTILSPSSFGLQPWKFIVIKNQELKNTLAPACYNQPQIVESSCVVVMCARTDIAKILEEYCVKSKADLGYTDEQTEAFKNMIVGSILSRVDEDIKVWAQKQVYLAGMSLMLIAAERGVDSCPMEGFDPAKVSAVLGLPTELVPTLIVPLGYRNMEEPKKTRFDFDAIVEERN